MIESLVANGWNASEIEQPAKLANVLVTPAQKEEQRRLEKARVWEAYYAAHPEMFGVSHETF